MKDTERQKVIKILKLLLTIDDKEVTKCTIESLLEELKENSTKKSIRLE